MFLNRIARIALAVVVGGSTLSAAVAQCPAYTQKDNVIEGAINLLPSGFCLYGLTDEQPGLYKADIKNFAQTLISGTEQMRPVSIDISDDGQWVVYIDNPSRGAGRPYISKIDGSSHMQIPVEIIPGEWNTAHAAPKVVGFLRKSPRGTEIFYYDYYFFGISRIRAVEVDLSGATPVFGADRIIAEITDSTGATPDTTYIFPHGGTQVTSVVGDQIFAYLKQIAQGQEALRNGFITIPDNGNGVAGPQNIYRWANDTYYPAAGAETWHTWWGCAQTMSHDGNYCASNSGFIGSACVPNKLDPSEEKMDHKGFYVTRFIRFDEPPIPIDDQIDNPEFGRSINWCPERLRQGTFEGVDFNYWNFSNSSEFVIGTLSGTMLEELGETNSLWIVHWPSNTWTKITPSTMTNQMKDPALFITDASSVRTGAKKASSFAGNKTLLHNSQLGSALQLTPHQTKVTLYSLSGQLLWSWKRAQGGATTHLVLPQTLRGVGQLIVRIE